MSNSVRETITVAPVGRVISPRRRWWALVVLMMPVLLVSIDNTVLNLALPAISEDLRPTGTQLLWVIDIYPLMLAGLLVAMGSLGDRIGLYTLAKLTRRMSRLYFS